MAKMSAEAIQVILAMHTKELMENGIILGTSHAALRTIAVKFAIRMGDTDFEELAQEGLERVAKAGEDAARELSDRLERESKTIKNIKSN